jgi:hypothetical protein
LLDTVLHLLLVSSPTKHCSIECQPVTNLTPGSDNTPYAWGGARDDGAGDAVGWSKPQIVYSQRQENTIPKLIANKLTTLSTVRLCTRLIQFDP